VYFVFFVVVERAQQGDKPMNIPMHRFKYTKLTKEQITSKLVLTAGGPKCLSEFSDALAGKSLKIVTDDGPVLSYSFKDKNKLAFSENNGAAVEAGYGALTLKHLTFFSHMVPGALKGYHVFVDLESNLVTMFEVWLCGGKDNQGQVLDDREVQRQIYFGYVAVAGKEAPKARHHTTNRIEGKGMYWKQDTGIETLEFYSSVISSNFVDLTRHADDLSYCSPSDYILIDDNLFVYDRTECEFSGIMTMYAVDLFTETQVGMRLGFNEKDELEYYMFRGTGKVVGHLTRLQPFNAHGEKINLGMGGRPQQNNPNPKGQRTAYRPARTFANMSEEAMHQAAEKNTIAFPWDPETPKAPMSVMSPNTPPLSNLLAGKEFTLRYDNDGPVWEYKVLDKKNLQWRNKGESQWHKETYRAFEADEKLVLFAHMHSGSKPRASVKIALDLINGLTTCILSKMGTEYYGNEVSYRVLFGAAEMDGVEAPKYLRHEFTDELVGHGFTRSWSDNMTSMHLYTTPHSAAWTIYTDDQTLGMQWCAPCIYIKLRDSVYLFNLVEEACDGIETCIAINEKTMRVCGFEYEGGSRGVDLTVVGAIARSIGNYDVKRFFDLKMRAKGSVV
jgi:hypothetical protein